MNDYLTKLMRAHPYIYGFIVYNKNSSGRKIKIFTIVENSIDDITLVVANVCNYRKNTDGYILFRGMTDVNEIAYDVSKVVGFKIDSRKL